MSDKRERVKQAIRKGFSNSCVEYSDTFNWNDVADSVLKAMEEPELSPREQLYQEATNILLKAHSGYNYPSRVWSRREVDSVLQALTKGARERTGNLLDANDDIIKAILPITDDELEEWSE